MNELNQPTSILDKPMSNILAIIIASIALFIPYINSDALDGAGMAALVLNWVPLIIGIVTIIFYLLSRLMTKKRNWILTGLGIALNILFVLSAIFSS